MVPVSEKVKNLLKSSPGLKGDTTGCGDNFAGGIITSVALQMKYKQRNHFDLIEAISWGVAFGGLTCFFPGGTYLENFPGEIPFTPYQNSGE